MAIRKAKHISNNPKSSQQLSVINYNYRSISTPHLRLEKQGLLLTESLKLLTDLKIDNSRPVLGETNYISRELDKVLAKNDGFVRLTDIFKLINR